MIERTRKRRRHAGMGGEKRRKSSKWKFTQTEMEYKRMNGRECFGIRVFYLCCDLFLNFANGPKKSMSMSALTFRLMQRLCIYILFHEYLYIAATCRWNVWPQIHKRFSCYISCWWKGLRQSFRLFIRAQTQHTIIIWPGLQYILM